MVSPIFAASIFALLFVLMLLRVPIGVALGLCGVLGISLIIGVAPAFDMMSLTTYAVTSDYVMGLIPLFIMMGTFAATSGMSTDLYAAANRFVGHRRGGLAMATILSSGAFSAICGSSVATAAIMGRVALPEMQANGYPGRVGAAAVAAGGTLGILIPPSLVMVIYGVLTEQDIGKLFIAGAIPGVLLVVLFLASIRIEAWRNPGDMPAAERQPWSMRLKTLRRVWPILLLFLFVLGGIYGGIFTTTEAAGMGAVGAFVIGLVQRRLGRREILAALLETLQITASIFLILIGALIFGYFLTITQIPQSVASFILGFDLGTYGTLAVLVLFYLAIGCVLDTLSIIAITVPVVYPIVTALGFDPIWFGVLLVVVIEVGLITPPIGMNVFVISSVARDVPIQQIFASVVPFILAVLVLILLLVAFPSIALWLPGSM